MYCCNNDNKNKDSNNRNSEHKGMMWMMVICCAVPILLVVILGLGGKTSGTSPWVIFGGIAVMIVAHFLIMNRSHKHSDEGHNIFSGEDKNKNNKNHSDHGSCH